MLRLSKRRTGSALGARRREEATMADVMIDRIRPGASVECTDGRLGSIDGVEEDFSGRPFRLRVTRGWTDQTVQVPFSMVRTVRDDGSVMLACAKADLREQLGDLADTDLDGAHDRTFAAPAEMDAGLPLGAVDRPVEADAYEQTISLREEELVAHKEMRELGEVEIRTRVEEVPSRLEVEAYREEVEIEHLPVGQVVSERVAPWEEDGVLVVPVYEEQLVVTKRLVLREHLRVRRIGTTETRLFEDTLRRERVVVDDPTDSGLVHELYPDDDEDREEEREERRPKRSGGFFGL